MKKVLCALGLMFTAVSSALATTYPLTIENCGYQETFTRPPERVVALGQNTVEILLLLGLQKQVVASAFWPTSVLPQLAEQNAKIKTLTVEIPSLESVLAQNPDFVPAQLPLLLGPESKVARREDLATVGVNSYVSPGMCATKKATADIRQPSRAPHTADMGRIVALRVRSLIRPGGTMPDIIGAGEMS